MAYLDTEIFEQELHKQFPQFSKEELHNLVYHQWELVNKAVRLPNVSSIEITGFGVLSTRPKRLYHLLKGADRTLMEILEKLKSDDLDDEKRKYYENEATKFERFAYIFKSKLKGDYYEKYEAEHKADNGRLEKSPDAGPESEDTN